MDEYWWGFLTGVIVVVLVHQLDIYVRRRVNVRRRVKKVSEPPPGESQ